MFEFAVDLRESGFCEQAATYGGLVGDDDDGITGLVEARNGFSARGMSWSCSTRLR